MKNLLIIIPHLRRGGAEHSVAKLSKLLEDSFNIHLVTFMDERLYETSYPYKGHLVNMGQTHADSVLSKVKNMAQRVAFLKKFKRVHNIDIALSYLKAADFVNILSRQQEKVLVSLRSFPSKNVSGKLDRSLIKRLYPKADIVIAQNQRVQKDIVVNFGVPIGKTAVLPNFYDFAHIKALYDTDTSPEWSDRKYLKLMQVGGVKYPKGQWHLFRIFKQVSEQIKKARLVIIGKGNMQEELTLYAQKLGLKVQDLTTSTDKKPNFEDYNVVLLGHINNPFRYLKQSDLFLFTSIYEGFPNALAEAMICACPVFSTDCQTGPKELIAPKTTNPINEYPYKTTFGILFPPFDGKIINAEAPVLDSEQLWIDHIIAYNQNNDEYVEMGSNARERMREFDQLKVKKQFINLLENA